MVDVGEIRFLRLHQFWILAYVRVTAWQPR